MYLVVCILASIHNTLARVCCAYYVIYERVHVSYKRWGWGWGWVRVRPTSGTSTATDQSGIQGSLFRSEPPKDPAQNPSKLFFCAEQSYRQLGCCSDRTRPGLTFSRDEFSPSTWAPFAPSSNLRRRRSVTSGWTHRRTCPSNAARGWPCPEQTETWQTLSALTLYLPLSTWPSLTQSWHRTA